MTRAPHRSAAVFLDRDGVINQTLLRDGKPYAPDKLEDFRYLPGVGDAIKALSAAGFRLIVVTNQPDVGRGQVPQTVVEAMHGQLMADLPVDAVHACFHLDSDGCACRKPKPGMLLAAAADWSIDLEASFMVGDRWSDVDAGRAAGCRTIWIDAGYRERRAEAPDFTVGSLPEAGRLILELSRKRRTG